MGDFREAELLEAFRSRLLGDAPDFAPFETYLDGFPDDVHDLLCREYASCTAPSTAGDDVGKRAEDDPRGLKKLGPYEDLEALGSGSYGTVYQAFDRRAERTVARKVLHRSRPGQLSALGRFRREALIAAKLEHPGICRVYEVGDQPRPFIAMALVPGRPLSAILRGEPQRSTAAEAESFHESITPQEPSLEPRGESVGHRVPCAPERIPEMLKVVEGTARALHAAHELGVIHRDVKPENIMVRPDGQPVLVDFGLARQLQSSSPRVSLDGDALGSPAYMSPEQIIGALDGVDHRADVWALGVVLYEALAGRRPFNGDRATVFWQIRNVEPHDIRTRSSSVSRDLSTVLCGALEKDRDARYSSALDLAEDLRRVRRHEPIRRKPPRWSRRAWLWGRRNPITAAALVAGLCVLVGAFVMVVNARGDEESARRKEASVRDRSFLAALPDEVEELLRRARDLWPRRPRRVPAMEAWLAEASRVMRALPAARVAGERIRNRGLTEPARSDVPHDRRPDLLRLLEGLGSRVTQVPPSPVRAGLAALWMATPVVSLCLRPVVRPSPPGAGSALAQFEDGSDERLHRALTRLEGLRVDFVRTVADVVRRRRYAREVVGKTVDAYRDAWKACLEDLGSDPKFSRPE